MLLLLEVFGREVVGTGFGRRILAVGDLGEGALAAEVVAALLLVLQLGQLGVGRAQEGDVEAALDARRGGGRGGAHGQPRVRAVRAVAAVVAT